MTLNKRKRAFRVTLPCRLNTEILLACRDEVDFEFAKLAYDHTEKCLVLKFKIKCVEHPDIETNYEALL